MRLVAADLAARGFTVCEPLDDESRRLKVTGLDDMHCEVTVSDCGCIVWYYGPPAGKTAEPTLITRLVLAALERPQCHHEAEMAGRLSELLPDLPVRCIVGRAVKDTGLAVSLEVYGDQTFFEVSAETLITDPADPGRGVVRVDEDGGLVWERWYPNPERTDAAKIAEALAVLLTTAAWPGSRPRAPSAG